MAGTRAGGTQRGRGSKSKKPAGAVIECDACLEIAQAEALLAEVNRALEQPDAVHVQAGQVETITTPCIQVFCALAKALETRKQGIIWESHSEKLLDVASLLGVREELGLPGA